MHAEINIASRPADRLYGFDKGIFMEKYSMRDNEGVPIETDVSQAFERVAKVLSEKFLKNIKDSEKNNAKLSIANVFDEFYSCLAERRGMLAGRPLLALGNTETNITALNCFVLPIIDDSIEGIYETIKQAAKIQQSGGGVGFNFSKIRPKGAYVKGVKSYASGPVSFMKSFDAMVATIASAGNRRGAAIAILNVDHPDIIEYITAKKDNTSLTNFNISIGVTDEFIQALKSDGEITLKHHNTTYGKIKAKEIFNKFIENSFNYNEPGLFFVDKINEWSNSYYYETLDCCNPCGEICLSDYGVCDLGMLVLPTFVKTPFINNEVDWDSMRKTIFALVAMLDTILDATNYPLKKNEQVAQSSRRIGLGITGLGDMLAMLKVKYDSEEAIRFVDKLMTFIRDESYKASVNLASLKGPFPKFDKDKYLKSKFVMTLPENIRLGIEEHGIRNVTILTCQPAGTISLLLNNISSGIEPIFSLRQFRKFRDENGNISRKTELVDYAYKYYLSYEFDKMYGEKPQFFQTTNDISLWAHFNMQNKIQQYVDNSIAKTINFPETYSKTDYETFMHNIITGDNYVKGLTTFREGTIASILTDAESKPKHKEELYKQNGYNYVIRRKSGKPSIHVTTTFKGNEITQLFLATKDIEYYKQLMPFSRMLSMIFAKEKNLTAILEILKELEDMNFVPTNDVFVYNNKEYFNELAAIKECIWDTLIELGLIKQKDKSVPIETECPFCKAKNSFVKEGKCNICTSCLKSTGVCEL